MKQKQLHKPYRLVTMLLLVMAILMPYGGAWAQTQPSEGDGSSEHPFLITTAEELKWYASYVNGESGDNVVHNTACAQLVKDIDLSTVCGEGKGNWTPIAKGGIYGRLSSNKFDGVFDGNGHTISNLYINDENGSKLGLFGYIYPTTEKTSVKNLKMRNVQIVGKEYCAAVCGCGIAVTLENIEVISGSIVGTIDIYGISGCGGSARNCINRANVTVERTYAAGIISNITGEVSNCSNYGKITAGKGRAGGIAAGSNGFTQLINCANYGEIHVTGTVNDTDYAVGGLLGYPWNIEISNCANFGNIYLKEQSDIVGVIVGTAKLKKASGILANTGNVYVNNVAQADVPVLQTGISWYKDNVDNTANCITPTAEQLASGWLAWQLQLNCGIQTWGQNISADPKDAYPVIDGSMLYAEGSCTDDLSAATSFSNDPGVVTHNLTHHDEVLATCVADGTIEYWSCSDCGKQWSDESRQHIVTDLTAKALGHDYIPADFDKNGLKYCSVCGHVEAEAPTLVAEETSEFNGYYALSKAGHLVWLHNQVQVYDTATDTYPNESIKCYLANDISLKDVCHPADAANSVEEASWNPIGDSNSFKGIFNGNGHTVSDLYINSSGSNLGLFGQVAGAEIKNVIVQGNVTGFYEDANSQSGQYVGLVLGIGSSGVKLENCESRGSVTGYKYVGGIVGLVPSSGGTITMCTNRATVKNYSGQSGKYFGGIVGRGSGLSLCANYADITTESNNVGGLAGVLSTDSNRKGMNNCMNVGNVKGKQNVGGLVGNCCAANNVNNYSSGRVEATSQYAGLLVGTYTSNPSAAFENTYYVKEGFVVENGTTTAGKYYGNGTISAKAEAIPQADVASGKLATMLASVNSTWGQDLEQENSYPVLNGKAVYFSGSMLCNGHLLSEAYTNDKTKEATTPAHSQEYDAGGFCTVCHESRELHGTGIVDDPFLISSVAQLEYLRDQSNMGSRKITAHAKLVNDIDLSYASASSWIPVSKSYSNGFAGTFDGNGHCIKNLYSSFNQDSYVGLFGCVYGGTIKNLTVEGVIESSCSNQGMIAGYSVDANYYNCVVKGRITTNGSSYFVGGIAGNISNFGSSNPVVQGCASYVDIVSTGTYTAGLVGMASNGINMEACANYGNVTGTANVGALMGYYNPNSESHITNCYVGSCEVRGEGANVFLTCFEDESSSSCLSNYEKVFYSKDAKVFASADATEPEVLASRIAPGESNTSSAFVGFSAQQVAGGEATYIMNNSTTSSPVWTQDLSQANSQPELNGNAAFHTVYKMGYAHGSTALSFSNNQNKENTLHAVADNHGSHDKAVSYVSDGYGTYTHTATCRECGLVVSEACSRDNDICTKCNYGDLFELADGEAYTLAKGAEVGELNYARNFGGTNWTTWYVPLN